MLLDHALMWILGGSHQLDLAAEKEKVKTQFQDQLSKPGEEVAVLMVEEQA